MSKNTKIGLILCSISTALITAVGITVKKMNSNKLSQKGLELIKQAEGFKNTAYKDSVGVLTIGYGHTGKDVYEGQTITQEQGDEILRNDISRFEKAVALMTASANLTQNQFDALVSFAFNLGEANLKRSTLLKKVLANPNDSSIRSEFLKWVYAGGKVLQGLVTRRTNEANLYFS